MIRKITFLLSFCFLANLSHAQIQPSFKYQAVARDAQGTIMANQSILLCVTILAGSSTGNPVYMEIHDATTNGQGLIQFEICGGTVAFGNCASLDWSTGDHFIKMEMQNPVNQQFVLLGISPLRPVPYAMYAGKSGEPSGWIQENGVVKLSDENNNVGLGRNNPNGKMHIYSHDPVLIIQDKETSSTFAESYIIFGETASSAPDGLQLHWKIGFTGREFTFNYRNTSSQTVEYMRIDDTGNLGIGINNPAAKLHIGGTPGIDGIKFPDGTIQTTAAFGQTGGTDNMGDHTLRQNIRLNNFWLSGDGDPEGIFINDNGWIGVNNGQPQFPMDINGGVNFNGPMFLYGQVPPDQGMFMMSDTSGNMRWGEETEYLGGRGVSVSDSATTDGVKKVIKSDIVAGEGVSVSDSATTDGVKVVVGLDKKCPSGYVCVDGSFCIQEDEGGYSNWYDAITECNEMDGRLCTYAEWYLACTQNEAGTISLNYMTDGWEWVSDASKGIETAEAMIVGDRECTDNSSTSVYSYVYFRCCADK